ncbi:MAG: adenosylcobinamide-GDP ribazoletransferase [Alphaproteobacteria bacterium]|nr:adenosylcobinamide-GDP ribazoletransferase [Alphaproteobacteria bacterium]
MRSLGIALRFLTRLPVPGGHEVDDATFAASLAWYPAVGALVGALLGALGLALSATPLAPILCAALVAVAAPLLTGGLHEDGLADTFDGLGGGWTRERALEIMRDSRVGAYGAIALVAALLLRAAALAGMAPEAWAGALIVAHGVGRLAPVLLIAALPYARGDAEGLAQPMVRGVLPWHVGVASLTALALALGFGLPGLAALGACGLITAALGRWYWRRVGGITGDLAGASVVAVELATLAVFAGVSPS